MTNHGRTRPKPFQCMECGKKLTLRQAERAVYGDGCPRCGGADIGEEASHANQAINEAAECGRPGCSGYKPDGAHDLAF